MKPKSYKFLKANIQDLPGILELFHQVRNHLRSRGLNQWPEHYPDPKEILESIVAESVWLFMGQNSLIGSFTLDEKQDPSYESIGWKYQAPRSFVLHKIAINPKYQSQGFGKLLTQKSIDLAREMGGDQLRLDTWSLNPASIALYEKLGFERAEGFCYFHGHKAPFICFEKKLAG